MQHLRFKALDDLSKKQPLTNPKFVGKKVDDIYGESVFGDKQLKAKLHHRSYESFRKSLLKGEPLDPVVADEIANAMKTGLFRKERLTSPIGFNLLPESPPKSTTRSSASREAFMTEPSTFTSLESN